MGRESRILVEALPLIESIFPAGWLEQEPEIVGVRHMPMSRHNYGAELTCPLLPQIEAEHSEARFRDLARRVLNAFAGKKRRLIIVFGKLSFPMLCTLVPLC